MQAGAAARSDWCSESGGAVGGISVSAIATVHPRSAVTSCPFVSILDGPLAVGLSEEVGCKTAVPTNFFTQA